jgi:RNA polymerase sigma-70 factor (ECF subfamily)
MNLIIKKSVNEQSLIEGCQRSDRKAQKDVYDRFSGVMLGVCRRYIKDTPEAEGVMVTGFLKVFNKIGQFSGIGSFEGWIRRIMVNESLLYLRKNKNMYLEVDIEHAETEPNYSLVAEYIQADELLNMVNSLSVGYRTVFNLYAIEGYSHKEIAEKLSINENTSKSQLSRARALLQKQVVEQEELMNEFINRHGKA